MSNSFISFDETRRRVVELFKAEGIPHGIDRLYLVRNLFGKVRISVSAAVEDDESYRSALQRLANKLSEALGAHGHPPEDAVLFVDPAILATFDAAAEKIDDAPRVFWVDRLMTGRDWWTVGGTGPGKGAARYTLFSVKGGVGRSTTAAVLAWHLTRSGNRVLVVDLDLESPGLSSAMLDPRSQPEFGVTDWFVEELVGQGDRIIERMTAAPRWAQDLEGDIRVVPAHGSDPGEYLAKLGRAYVDTHDDPWTARLKRLLAALEARFEPTVVLLESRSGLHDIAAATVTDLDAQVLLFAIDSESTWTDYAILFQHWQSHRLARSIRERLSIVSALTPTTDRPEYINNFREAAWNLFQNLYDEAPSEGSGEVFSYDLHDEDAPHNPMPVYWTLDFAAGASLRNLDPTAVNQAYENFLKQFDKLVERRDDGGSG